jgi:hypothetical protein
MIESRSDTRRLSSIDAANWLGRLADSVVIAASHCLSGLPLDSNDHEALQTAAHWVDQLRHRLAEPLDLSHIGGDTEFPGSYSFNSDVTGAAIHAIGGDANREAEINALDKLGITIRAVDASIDHTDSAQLLVTTFESIARAMLSAAGSLLVSPTGFAWPQTFSI